MPEQGKYKKIPRPESIEYFIGRVSGHKKVCELIQLDNQLFRIKKHNNELLVFVTNYYVVSEAEVYEITSQYKNLDCIVTISAWNSYSKAGKEASKIQGIGLFVMNEFLGALNFDGKAFINYITPEERERRKRESR